MSERQPISVPAPRVNGSGLLATLGWAAFLGVSWTWCIGMFLPALLVRDYGIPGWVVFAVPNVAGAAAMGWVLCRPTAGDRVAWSHRGAGVFFSVVTIAFHAYWVYWVVRGLIGPAALAAVPALALGFYFVGRWKKHADWWLAVGVWCVSVAAFVAYALFHRGLRDYGPAELPRGQLLPLALVCLLGFALCPYLDLTFLRARQATAPKPGIAAFAVGFGVVFCLMIVFTLVYAPAMIPGRWGLLPTESLRVLGVHMTLQAAITIAFHAREIARRWPQQDPHVRVGGLAAVAASLFPLAAGSLADGLVTPAEQTYRLFLAFYALVFPAYVWILMLPRRGQRTAEPTSRGLAVFAIAVCVAGPMYWLAFVNGRMNWLFPGVAVVLLARLFAPRERLLAPQSLG